MPAASTDTSPHLLRTTSLFLRPYDIVLDPILVPTTAVPSALLPTTGVSVSNNDKPLSSALKEDSPYVTQCTGEQKLGVAFWLAPSKHVSLVLFHSHKHCLVFAVTRSPFLPPP